MRSLIEFLQRNVHWLVFLLLEAISLRLLVRSHSYQGSVYFTTASAAVGTLQSWVSRARAYTAYGAENRALEAENQRLRSQVYALRAIQRWRDIAGDTLYSIAPDTVGGRAGGSLSEGRDTPLATYHTAPALVVGATLHKANNLLTIDAGEADGVHEQMGVVSSTGVVGIVYLTSRHYALVIPLLNTASQLSCRIKGSNSFGTMQWRHGDAARSYVTGIPRHADVKVGDEVETNGYSDIFPEGIPVGVVEAVHEGADGMTYELTVRLSTDFSTLRNVSVLTDYSHSERQALEARAAEEEPAP